MTDNMDLLRTVAVLYYNEGLTQEQIAKRIGISRPKVSRKLMEAREVGVVKIFIDQEIDEQHLLEERLHAAFHLKGVRVATVPNDDLELAVKIVAAAGAEYCASFFKPGDCIGINWGLTLYEMSKSLPELNLPDTMVVQLGGGVDNAHAHSYAQEIISNLSSKLKAENAFYLPWPAIVGSREIHESLLKDKKLKSVLALGKKCNKIFVNIALPDESSCLYQAGYITDSDAAKLKKAGAVGSICSRFFNADGAVCMKSLDERTIGISINDITKAEYVFLCTVGVWRAKAVYAALKSGLVNVAVIDAGLAKKLLDLAERDNR